MACFKQWLYFSSAVGGYAVGTAAVIAGVVAEVGTAGTATPAAIATIVGGIIAMLASLAAMIATEIDLIECYDQAGKAQDAAKIRARLAVHQGEQARLEALLTRLRTATGV